MNPYGNLPDEWQGPRCPGNGHGCGTFLWDEVIWERINSRGVIRRICHYGHSMEGKIPVEIPERPIIKGKWKNLIDSKPRCCDECEAVFIPYSNRQENCGDPKCRKHRQRRNGYIGHLLDSRREPTITRKYARELAFQRYPRLKDLQERKKFRDRDECMEKIMEGVRQKEIGIKTLAILTAVEGR